MWLTLALMLAAQEFPPPRTVNDQVLGTAEHFSVEGPARVCLRHTSIDLEAGETAWLDYLGIHQGGFRVTGPRGTFQIMEGDAWAEPRGGQAIEDLRGRRVERHRRGGRRHYLIFNPSNHPVVWIEGDALGRSRDIAILARIDVALRDQRSCDRRYYYGWSEDGAGVEVGQARRIPEEQPR